MNECIVEMSGVICGLQSAKNVKVIQMSWRCIRVSPSFSHNGIGRTNSNKKMKKMKCIEKKWNAEKNEMHWMDSYVRDIIIYVYIYIYLQYETQKSSKNLSWKSSLNLIWITLWHLPAPLPEKAYAVTSGKLQHKSLSGFVP